MSENVLEIGYGDSPALFEGSMFQDQNVRYVGVELPTGTNKLDHLFHRQDDDEFGFPELQANIAALPFANETFDIALMRDVYAHGMYGHANIQHIRLGVYEIRRVLKDSGLLVIAEESTPCAADYIASELISAMFEIEQQHKMAHTWDSMPPDDPWYVARKPFYANDPHAEYNFGMFGKPHITYGRKIPNVPVKTTRQRVFHPTQKGLSLLFDFPEIDDTGVLKRWQKYEASQDGSN